MSNNEFRLCGYLRDNVLEAPNVVQNNDCLSEIDELRVLNVRNERQDVLEQQALTELQLFSEQNSNKNTEALLQDERSSENPGSAGVYLNLENYLKRQEELKKHSDHKRSLQINEHSEKIVKDYCRKRQVPDVRLSETKKKKYAEDSGSEYNPSDSDECNSENVSESAPTKPKKSEIKRITDDGCLKSYKRRLKDYYKSLENTDSPEYLLSDINVSGLRVPAKLWNNLYGYQQKGIEWLWEIHQQRSGGLLGDEMGLGKTVEVIVFLAALEYSRAFSSYIGLGPTLIVAPATVVHQWVTHFHEWAPEFRVAILHHSGSFAGTNKAKLVKEINQSKGILITTYSGILRYKQCLADHQWHYLILDEGHKIRNPNAKVTIAIKQLRTPHRLMLTGSPMQNNLQELWSIFDFVEPAMLGTLPTFMEHINNPIIQGGYTNATPMQEATALSVATALKDIISPRLLRRTKAQVKDDIRLPNKCEQVLFCSLTEEQHNIYKNYLMSEHISMILGRGKQNWFSQKHIRANVLVAITTLRKICNHPDLYLEETDLSNEQNDISLKESHGYYRKSGKMVVVSALLKIWKKQHHRVLLFTQSRAMINVFETFLTVTNYKYLKMDGSTTISARQPLINKFNTDTSFDVFLSTTRVGGLGVNLIGASRVIIYDPDWNPATDTQARERAWRIGQNKHVTVYRLVSAGTIEEKVYQRQVWKQLLANKVLIDPRTQKFFKASDLHDLFSLPYSIDETNLETANIFKNSRVNIQKRINKKKHKNKCTSATSTFSEEKLQAMKRLAQEIAKSISPPESINNDSERRSSYQKELEEDRHKKLQQKEILKQLSPLELRILNREKADSHNQIQIPVNEIDDSETNMAFSKALEVSADTAKLYNCLKSKKHKDQEVDQISDSNKLENVSNRYLQHEKKYLKHKRKNKKRSNEKVDISCEIDGERVEGLMKSEIKSNETKKKSSSSSTNQDQYVLEKLFSGKGVHSALQHDIIVQSGHLNNNIKIHYEAQQRTDLALQALKKSRLGASN